MLTHRFALYVPSTKGSKKAPARTVNATVKKVKEAFSRLFGGFTAYKAQGGWVGNAGKLIQETITVIVAYASDTSQTLAVEALAREIALKMGQEAVSVEVDGTLRFVTVAAAAA